MKRIFYLLLLVLSWFFSTPQQSLGQSCPPPENLIVQITGTAPQTANVTWTEPSGTVLGYQFTYQIDNNPPVVLILPPGVSSYSVTLPEGWQTIEVSLQTICDGGRVSDVERIKVTSIVIVDLVLANQARESAVCLTPCPNSTHFYYSGEWNGSNTGTSAASHEGSITGGEGKEIFVNETFCQCMANNNNEFNDFVVVDACKRMSKMLINPNLYVLNQCNIDGKSNISNRNAQPASNYWSATVVPNPGSDYLGLAINELSVSKTVQVHVFHSTGKLMAFMPEMTGSAGWDTTAWPRGLYLVDLTDDAGQKQQLKWLKI